MNILNSDILGTMQYSTDKFYADYSKTKKVDIGKAQWCSIRNIEAKYAGEVLTECEPACKFNDDIWKLDAGRQINWGKHIKAHPEQYPLLLTLKIAAFYRIQVAKMQIADFHGQLTKFMAVFGQGMKREGVLTANVNQPFVPANVISEEKITQYLFAAIERGEITSGGFGVLSLLERIIATPASFFQSADMLRIDVKVPWRDLKTEQNIGRAKFYLAKIFGVEDELKIKSYQAFSEDVIAGVLPPAIGLIEKHSALLIKAFDITATPSAYQKLNPIYFMAATRDDLKIIHAGLTKDFPNWPFAGFQKYNVTKKIIEDWYDLAQGAALWVLMLTTALRGVDIRENLFRNCYDQDGDSDLIFYLLTDIKKTKTKDYIIPVPSLTIKAIDYLNSTNHAPADVPNLTVRRTKVGRSGQANTWHYPKNGDINRLLRLWAEFCEQNVLDGLDEEDNQDGMAHRCRATMAGWVGTNSPLSVLIVRRLFGHKNGVMPDHYLRGNRHVQQVREELRSKTYSDFSSQMADAIVDNKFSGGVRDILSQGREHLKGLIIEEASRNNESLTEGDIRKRLKERIRFILLAKLNNGDMLALQTPLAFVCTRNPGSATDAPCAINSTKNQRLEQEIDKTFATSLQMTGLPELDNCKGASCQHSFLYDNPIARTLLEQFKYYTLYLRGIKHTDIDLDKEAKSFVSLYTKPLTDVYPDAVKSIAGAKS
jgi:integrase